MKAIVITYITYILLRNGCVCIAAVVGVLVGTGFEENQGPLGPSRRTSATCCSILDDMLYCESVSLSAVLYDAMS